MPSADHKEKNPAINSDVAEAMAKYGIARVPVDYFHYKEFRYTNLTMRLLRRHVRTGRHNDLDAKSKLRGLSAGEGTPRCRPSIQ
jgi:hypothetical protein